MSGAGGSKGRKGDQDKPKEQEFFDEVQDWVDDEGGAPGVID